MKRRMKNMLGYWDSALVVFLTIVAVVILCIYGAYANASLSECIDATCRVSSGGTGCVFEVTDEYVYVLTNAHVVRGESTIKCVFWQGGHQSSPIPGRVTRVSEAADAAVIVLYAKHFSGRVPKPIPIAPRDYTLTVGQTIASAGCPGGAWTTGWRGHVLGHNGKDILFTPTPALGRSGSAIFDAGGTQIVGLLWGQANDKSHGTATNTQALYDVFSNARKAQCGPNGCPVPNTQRRPILPYGGKLIPWKPQTPQSNQWPTLPPVSVPAPSPSTQVDFSSVEIRLDNIAGLLVDMQTTEEVAADDHKLNPLVVAGIVLGGVVLGFVVFFNRNPEA